MRLPLRAFAVALVVVAAACGGDGPDEPETIVDDGPLASTSARETPSGPPSDDEVLRLLAEEVADEQRPGEFVDVANITYFDDPDGCASGEAAFVSIELSGEPAQGEALFCKVDADPGWELSQGILYGE